MSRGRNIHPLALVPERQTQTMEIMCDLFFSALFTCFVLSLYFIYHKLLTKNTEFIYNCCKHTFVSDKMIIYRTLPSLLSHQSNIVRHFTQSAILNLQRSAVFNLKEIQHRNISAWLVTNDNFKLGFSKLKNIPDQLCEYRL